MNYSTEGGIRGNLTITQVGSPTLSGSAVHARHRFSGGRHEGSFVLLKGTTGSLRSFKVTEYTRSFRGVCPITVQDLKIKRPDRQIPFILNGCVDIVSNGASGYPSYMLESSSDCNPPINNFSPSCWDGGYQDSLLDLYGDSFAGFVYRTNVRHRLKLPPPSPIALREVRGLSSRPRLTNLDMTEVVADLTSTGRFVSDRAKTMAQLVRSIVARNPKAVYQALSGYRNSPAKSTVSDIVLGGSKKTSSIYLELMFGWIPILESVSAAIDDLAGKEPLNRRPENTLGRFYCPLGEQGILYSYDLVTADGKNLGTVSSGIEMVNRRTLFGTTKTNSSFRGYISDIGLHPVDIAWAALPLSFVVNWFVDVSSGLKFIRSGQMDQSYTLIDATKWIDVRVQATGQLSIVNDGVAISKFYSRRVTSKYFVGFPALYQGSRGLNLGKAISGLALAIQRLR